MKFRSLRQCIGTVLGVTALCATISAGAYAEDTPTLYVGGIGGVAVVTPTTTTLVGKSVYRSCNMVAVGNDGYVYVRDRLTGSMWRFSRATGQTDTSWSVETGVVTNADQNMTMAPDGSLYVTNADTTVGGAGKLQKIDTVNKTVTDVSGLTGLKQGPFGIAFADSNTAYVSYYNTGIYKYTISGDTWTKDTTFNAVSPFGLAYGLAIGSDGYLYTTNYTNTTYKSGVFRYSLTTNSWDTNWSRVSPNGSAQRITSLSLGPDGKVYTSSNWGADNGRVFCADIAGAGTQTMSFYNSVLGPGGGALSVAWYIPQQKAEQPVPEPGSMAALGTGLMGLVGLAFKRRK